MNFICFFDLLLSVIFLYLILQKYTFESEGIFFLVFYSFDRGGSIVLNILLLGQSFRKKLSVARLHLFLIYVALEIAGIIGYIVHYRLDSSHLWSEGYIFIIFNAVMTVIFLRRYFFLREIKMYELAEMEAVE